MDPLLYFYYYVDPDVDTVSFWIRYPFGFGFVSERIPPCSKKIIHVSTSVVDPDPKLFAKLFISDPDPTSSNF